MATKVYVITGPIGSGKSTAIEYLKNKGFSTVDLDKVSNDILNSDQSSSISKVIPKDTENLIQEAENALKKKQEPTPQIKKKENSTIQVVKEGDLDPLETSEWLESLSAVIEKDGNQRAHYLIKELINKAYMEGANIPYTQNTPYINTIPVNNEKKSNGDQNIERRIRSLIRWNAAAMVVRANKKFPELGGHIGTFASAAICRFTLKPKQSNFRICIELERLRLCLGRQCWIYQC